MIKNFTYKNSDGSRLATVTVSSDDNGRYKVRLSCKHDNTHIPYANNNIVANSAENAADTAVALHNNNNLFCNLTTATRKDITFLNEI